MKMTFWIFLLFAGATATGTTSRRQRRNRLSSIIKDENNDNIVYNNNNNNDDNDNLVAFRIHMQTNGFNMSKTWFDFADFIEDSFPPSSSLKLSSSIGDYDMEDCFCFPWYKILANFKCSDTVAHFFVDNNAQDDDDNDDDIIDQLRLAVDAFQTTRRDWLSLTWIQEPHLAFDFVSFSYQAVLTTQNHHEKNGDLLIDAMDLVNRHMVDTLESLPNILISGDQELSTFNSAGSVVHVTQSFFTQLDHSQELVEQVVQDVFVAVNQQYGWFHVLFLGGSSFDTTKMNHLHDAQNEEEKEEIYNNNNNNNLGNEMSLWRRSIK